MINGVFNANAQQPLLFWGDNLRENSSERFCFKVQNTGSAPVVITGFNMSFLLCDSNGQAFLDADGVERVVSNWGATMQANLTGSNQQDYSAHANVSPDSSAVMHLSQTPGETYWTPNPGNVSVFEFYAPVTIDAGDTRYLYISGSFWGKDSSSAADLAGTCIQFTDLDSIMLNTGTYNVTWDLNGGTHNSNPDNIVTQVAAGATTYAPSVEKTNYTFVRWQSANTNVYPDITTPLGSTGAVNENRSYQAIWSANTNDVRFYQNISNDYSTLGYGDNDAGLRVGVSGDPNAINPVLQSNPIHAGHPTLANLVTSNIRGAEDGVTGDAKGYLFYCWRRDSTIKKIPSSQTISDSVNLYEELVNANQGNRYYAVWKAVSGPVKFYRNYNAEDAQYTNVSNVDYIDTILGDIKPANPTREGYTFIGWSLSRSGSVVGNNLVLWDGEVSGVPIDTFYAIWQPVSGSVDFYRNYIDGDTTHQSVNNVIYINSTLGSIKSQVNNPTREGYTFTGWSLTQDGSSGVAADSTPLWNNGPVTRFYAKWGGVTGPVRFYNNTTPVDDTYQEVLDVDYVVSQLGGVKNEITPPTRSGYTLLGWSRSRNSNVVEDNSLVLWDSQTDTPIDSFYAVWALNQVTVTFKRNCGGADTAEWGPTTVAAGSTIAYAANVAGCLDPTPKDPGYFFAGWALSSDGLPVSEDTYLTGNATYYARWKVPNVYFHRNFSVADTTLIGSRAGAGPVGWRIGIENPSDIPVHVNDNAPQFGDVENFVGLGILESTPGNWAYQGGLNMYRYIWDDLRINLLPELEALYGPCVLYGWRKDRRYTIIRANEDVETVNLRNNTIDEDESNNHYYAVWKRLRGNTVWVVREVEVEGIRGKVWVKELDVHKVVSANDVKEWVDTPIREVTSQQGTKSWTEKR